MHLCTAFGGTLALVLLYASLGFAWSGEYLLIHPPLFPESYEECTQMAQKFSTIIQQLNADHEACLQSAGASSSNREYGPGVCSKPDCQSLHTQRYEAAAAQQKAQDTCQQRVAEFQQKKHAEEARRRAEEQRQADRRAAVEERERQRDQRAKEGAQRRDKEARDREERRQQEQEAARAKDTKKHWDLVKKAYEARDELVAAVETARDPVGTVESKIRSKLEESVRATPDEPGQSDYRFVQERAKELNSFGTSANPFAEAVSGAALDEIGWQHTTALGQLNRAGEQIRDFTPGDLKSMGNPFASSASATRQSLPAQGDAPTQQTADVDTPATTTSPQRTAVAEPETPSVSNPPASSVTAVNPWVSDVRETKPASRISHDTAPPLRTYVDPETKTEFVIPAGHVLYRDPATRKLRVVRRSALENIPSSSDRPEAGANGCSATGLGIITPECERKRQKNPFAADRGAS